MPPVTRATASTRDAWQALVSALEGRGDRAAPARVAAPYRLAISGDALGAAAAWEAIGRPYEAAEALSLTDDDDALLRALAAFDQLGARPAADRLRRQLRERGVRAVPRGPRRPLARCPRASRPASSVLACSRRARPTPRSRRRW